MSKTFRPSDLLFSQTSISSTLTDGDSIHDLIRKISERRMNIDVNWLPIDVAKDKYDGKYYAQNNRRLYIFRVLEKRGLVGQIPVRMTSMKPKSANAGVTINFRDGTRTLDY